MDASKLASVIRDTAAVGSAALLTSLHILRVLANRGLVSPGEVDTIYEAVTGAMEMLGTEDMQLNNFVNVSGMFVEIQQSANEHWIGKGKTNPK